MMLDDDAAVPIPCPACGNGETRTSFVALSLMGDEEHGSSDLRQEAFDHVCLGFLARARCCGRLNLMA
jgi:hypothetical protein